MAKKKIENPEGPVFPGTPGLVLDPPIWFEPPYKGCRARVDSPNLVVGHWTAGEGNLSNDDQDAARLVRVLQNTMSRDGRTHTPLSIHTNIGGFGRVVQLADALKTVTYHAGAVNDRSIGVEMTSVGMGTPRSKRPRAELTQMIKGRRVEFLAFTKEQIESWVTLCDYYAEAFGIPKVVPGDPKTGELYLDRLTGERANFSGFTEHLHWSSSKYDAGGQLMQALLDAGYKLG